MRRIAVTKTIGVMAALTLVAAACAGSDEPASPAVDDVVSDADADVTTTIATTSSATASTTEEPLGPAAPAIVPDRWIEGITADAPSSSGWSIEPGEWASNAFEHPVLFDLPAGLAVRDNGPWSIRLVADRPDTIGQIHLVRASTLTLSNGSSVPIPNSFEEVTELMESTGTSTMLDQGRFDRPGGVVGWWKFEVDADIPATPCLLGDKCVRLAAATSGDPVEIVPGEPLVIFRYFGDDTRFAAYVTGPAEELPELVEATEHIMASFTVLTDSEAEPPATNDVFLSEGSTGFAPGSYHRMFGPAATEFELDDSFDGLRVAASSPEMVILSAPGTDLAIIFYEGMVVDPAVEQSDVDPNEVRLLPRLDDPPTNIDEWASFADQLGQLTTVGSSEIGGEDVPWFEFEVRPGSGFACWPGFPVQATECIEFLTTWAHSDGESNNRHFVYGDEGVLVIVFPAESVAIDDALETWQPILDTLSVTRPG